MAGSALVLCCGGGADDGGSGGAVVLFAVFVGGLLRFLGRLADGSLDADGDGAGIRIFDSQDGQRPVFPAYASFTRIFDSQDGQRKEMVMNSSVQS